MPFRWMLLIGLSALAVSADAGEVRVKFDARQTVACQDVTDEQFAAAHPGERLWEAKLEVSSLISGSERLLTSYFYQVDALQNSLVFQDYLPQTTVESRYAGNVDVDKKDESSSELGLAVTLNSVVKVTPTAGMARKRSSQVRYSLLPPKEQVAASGTQRRGRGVYFKLRPSSQHTLEGGKEFAVVFRAPSTWRGGTLLLRCQATGVEKGLFRDEQRTVGQAVFMLACYQAGDAEAKQLAEDYSRAEHGLRRAAHLERAAIGRRQTDDSAFRLPGAEPTRGPVPADWLERLLVTPGRDAWPQYADHLPPTVRESGEAFLTAKQELGGLAH